MSSRPFSNIFLKTTKDAFHIDANLDLPFSLPFLKIFAYEHALFASKKAK
jgi:hypothetical protein